jgi:hypothetical protein
MEPLDPVRKVPEGGWPRALLRVDLLPDMKLRMAIYEVACASRHYWRGVVTDFEGTLLVAWPHQSVDEIARTYQRLRAETVQSLGMTEDRDTHGLRFAFLQFGLDRGYLTPSEFHELAGPVEIRPQALAQNRLANLARYDTYMRAV